MTLPRMPEIHNIGINIEVPQAVTTHSSLAGDDISMIFIEHLELNDN